MSKNVTCHDLFELKYLNDKNKEKVHFESYLDLAKYFIMNAEEKHFSVLSATYYFKLWIVEGNSDKSDQPDKRFAEHAFSPEDFLTLSADWVEKTRNSVNHEIDAYMAEHYGSIPQS